MCRNVGYAKPKYVDVAFYEHRTFYAKHTNQGGKITMSSLFAYNLLVGGNTKYNLSCSFVGLLQNTVDCFHPPAKRIEQVWSTKTTRADMPCHQSLLGSFTGMVDVPSLDC
jgi:hypothetical protein